MTLNRRDFLRLAGLVAGSTALAACGPVYRRLGGEPEAPVGWLGLPASDFAALNRLTFGPRAEERRRAADIGLAGWIEEQLAPEAVDDGPIEWRLREFDTLGLTAADLAELGDKLFDDLDKAPVVRELRQATLLRQVYSRRQLYETLVEFWSDHFNISVEKGDCWFLKTVDDRAVIRPHALGNFRDLVQASAHSPAMLVYLDNQVNHKGAPNENYARELMELHTLGVDGGYTQADVMELARALTGWTVKEHFWRGDFTFDLAQHDDGPKTVLGMLLEPGGQREAELAIDALAARPATAGFIAGKLARRFVADDPPPDLVQRAANAFTRTGGDIRSTLRAILLDGLADMQPKYKRPLHLIASALRPLNAQTDGGPALYDYLARMGQPHFGWPTPDGYPDRSAAWQGSLMPRWQFALALARDEIEGTRLDLASIAAAPGAGSPAENADALAGLLLGAPLPASARDDLLFALAAAGAGEAELPGLVAAGIVASPAFQWR